MCDIEVKELDDEVDCLDDFIEFLHKLVKYKFELHSHQCQTCKHIWSHKMADFKTEKEFVAGHTCPACGEKDVCEKYFPEEHVDVD